MPPFRLQFALAVLLGIVTGCAGKAPPPTPHAVDEAQRLAQQALRLQMAQDWVGATTWWERAARQFQLVNQLTNVAMAWHNQALCLRESSQFDPARSLLEQAAELNQQLGQTNTWWRNQIALLQLDELSAPDRAAERAKTLALQSPGLRDSQLAALLALETAQIDFSEKKIDEAWLGLERARAGFASNHDSRGLAVAAVLRARILRDRGDLAASESAWRESLASFERLGDPRGIAICLAGLGSCLAAEGHDLAQAESLLRRAMLNFHTLRLSTEEASVSAELRSMEARR